MNLLPPFNYGLNSRTSIWKKLLFSKQLLMQYSFAEKKKRIKKEIGKNENVLLKNLRIKGKNNDYLTYTCKILLLTGYKCLMNIYPF